MIKLSIPFVCIALLNLFGVHAFLSPVETPRRTTARTTNHLQLNAESTTPTSATPSWEELTTRCPHLDKPAPLDIDSALNLTLEPQFSSTKPTLFRERHGWCPYSERVWLALELKGIEYDTIRIDNNGRKPNYYRGQTPQIRWPDGSTKGGTMQGESMDILKELDIRYPDAPMRLYNVGSRYEDKDVLNAVSQFQTLFPSNARPSSRAAFLFNYNGDALWKSAFQEVLEDTNDLLSMTSKQGPYFCGAKLTAADVAWAPFLERYAAQLPCLHDDLSPKNRELYPHLCDWYDAMEAIPVYASRIRGNESSWRKVLLMAGYGNGGYGPPRDVVDRMSILWVQGACQTEEEEIEVQAVWDLYAADRPYVGSTPKLDAAGVMVRNREAILLDATKRIVDLGDGDWEAEDVDVALRGLVSVLTGGDGGNDGGDGDKVKSMAAFLDERMCVPRDMGAPSAAAIKRVALS